MERKLTHLQMIQGVINRLSMNSFLLKGWTVVIVCALFAFAAKESRIEFVYLALVPAVAFWGLDGYFLWQERMFRNLYDVVRQKPADEIDFSMKPIGSFNGQKLTWLSASFSKTLIPFHGILVATVFLILVLTAVRG